MRVSEICVKLSKEDILGLLEEVITFKGLKIDDIEIDRVIRISGSFKRILRVKFRVAVEIIEVKKDELVFRLKEIKVLGIPAIKLIRKFVLKNILKDLKNMGVVHNEDKVIINFNKLMKDIKNFEMDIKEIQVNKSGINVTLHNVVIDIKDIIKKGNKDKIENEILTTEEDRTTLIENNETLLLEEKTENIEKVQDVYTDGRSFLEEKIPDNIKPMEEYLFILPDIIALIVRLLKDSRVSKSTKIAVASSLGYIIIPKDIINDKIPLLGKIDDISVVFFALNKLINDVPLEVLLENWQGSNKNILVLKNALEYLKSFSNGNKLDKFYVLIDSFV
ncbi:DUF1232 domain-containing protein [Clostridium sp. 'White wine YQ']|uniref:DUF1232 domain-containing protein n=1 Tax=Clostridium sp. 'White wine YQ' TaxID=3027474 RepID=UPI0023654C46|nr:DUF1232 domain-containing protein [Clostridium sp. 'White wine YQ']MDD7792935.1 DUF1232 domain-containing protein [Clostridium sp. 'White wine YQ']